MASSVIRTRLIHTVTIHNKVASTTSIYGDDIETWDGGITTKALVQQVRRGAQEVLEGRDTSITPYRVILPPEMSIHCHDHSQIRWGGISMDVTGNPELVYAANELSHVEAKATEVVG